MTQKDPGSPERATSSDNSSKKVKTLLFSKSMNKALLLPVSTFSGDTYSHRKKT